MTREQINEAAWLLALPAWLALWIAVPLPAEGGLGGVVAWYFRMAWANRNA